MRFYIPLNKLLRGKPQGIKPFDDANEEYRKN